MAQTKQRLILVCLLLGLGPAVHASTQAKSVITLHDLQQQDSRFLVTGNDPYLITKPDNDAPTAAYIELSLRVYSNTTDRSTLRMELFFKPMVNPSNQSSRLTIFDPQHRIQFLVDKDTLLDGDGGFLLPLPETMNIADLSLVRLDIDGCKECSIELLSHPTFLSKPKAGLPIIKPNRTLNGCRDVQFDGFQIPIEELRLNDLTRTAFGLIQTGEDPYLTSPYLDFTTNNLGGVFIKLKALNASGQPLDFQLFYATEAHGFIETASISERIHYTGEADLVFVIPMSFLSEQQPARNVLERIRLDLPYDETTIWQLTEFSIMSKQQLEENRHWIPKHLVMVKQQRASKRTLLKNSVTKVLSDLGFLVSYLILLIMTCLLFWRSYRK